MKKSDAIHEWNRVKNLRTLSLQLVLLLTVLTILSARIAYLLTN